MGLISQRGANAVLRWYSPFSFVLSLSLMAVCLFILPSSSLGQSLEPGQPTSNRSDLSNPEDWNQRLQELMQSAESPAAVSTDEYRIGPYDLLEITIFQAPEMNRQVRVSASGEITIPLLGAVQAAGLSTRELEFVLQELLRRRYMKDPHVGVFVAEMKSHPVSVFGAVKRPGVYQIQGIRTLIEILALAEGLADDAGDTVVVMRGAGSFGAEAQDPHSSTTLERPAGFKDSDLSSDAEKRSVEIDLKALLETGDPSYNVTVYPGDIVKVTRAGIVYVVGEVRKPGGFVLKTNENISVLQALALGEGLTSTAAKGRAQVIRTDDDGERIEIPIDLGEILKGKADDPLLQPNDIVFVPNSAGKKALYTGLDAAIRTVSGVIIWRGR